MRKYALSLDDILVESFPTDVAAGSIGTVKGREADTEQCEDTIFTWVCRSCPDTNCGQYTCQTCPPVITCNGGQSCAPELTCTVDCNPDTTFCF